MTTMLDWVEGGKPYEFTKAASACQPAMRFFHQHLHQHETLRLAFHIDEAKLNDGLKPGKAVHCSPWTILEMPSWWRSRECGWFVLGYAPSKLLQGHLVSRFFCFILEHIFFPKQGWNFLTTGLELTSNDGSGYHVKARVACLIADEKAVKEVLSVKGAAGWRCCASCENVWNKNPLGRNELHYRCSNFSRLPRVWKTDNL